MEEPCRTASPLMVSAVPLAFWILPEDVRLAVPIEDEPLNSVSESS